MAREPDPGIDKLRTLAEVTCHELIDEAESCDLCFCLLSSPEVTYSWAEGRAICDPCQERFGFEPKEVNKTIGLVARGYYAYGATDPGPNQGGLR